MGIQKLLCGNCLKYIDSMLQEIHSLNKTPVIVTDPPFNIGYHYNRYCDKLSDREYWDMLRDIFIGRKAVVIHYPEKLHRLSWELATEPTKVISWVYNSNTRKQHRDIAFYDIIPNMTQVKQPYKNLNDKRIKQRILDGHIGAPTYDWWNVNQVKNTSKEKTKHPCQMPLEVMKNIVGVLPNRKDIAVIDPFMGSGTTGVACGYYDIDFYGIELDKTYFDIASERILQEEQAVENMGIIR